jgi:hypothetical protein
VDQTCFSEVQRPGSPSSVDDEDSEFEGIKEVTFQRVRDCRSSDQSNTCHSEEGVDIVNVDEPATMKYKAPAAEETYRFRGDTSDVAPPSPMPEIPEIISLSTNQSTASSALSANAGKGRPEPSVGG